MNKPMTKLIDKAFDLTHHPYFTTMMVSGLVKSTIGTFLMTIGGSILVYSWVQPGNYASHTPFTATAIIIGGVLVYFVGDIYKVIQKRREEEELKKQYITRLEKLEERLCSDINELRACKEGDCKEHTGSFCSKYTDDDE